MPKKASQKEPLMEAVRELREAMGMVREDFAAHFGLRVATAASYELRSASMSLPLLWRFAEAAATVGRSDLAKQFREAALEPYLTNPEGIIAQTEAQRTPPMVLRALERLRDAALSTSRDVALAAERARIYLEWRDRVQAGEVEEIEVVIDAQLKAAMRGRPEPEIRKVLGK